MAIAYSYIRFSRATQALCDSERRQHKLAVNYAQKHKLTLSSESYKDLGVSAFKGKNATEGRLKAFLDAVDKGTVKPGSFLLVESLDRLSRNDVDEALELLLSIIRRGITIVTLADERVYSKANIKADKGISLIISIAVIVRANDESAMKSQRTREAWEGKRARGEILSKHGPSWLVLSEDRKKWRVLVEKVRIVGHVFDLALKGYGVPTIARMLNAEGLTTLKHGRPWNLVTVHKLLTDPAVIGTLQSDNGRSEPIAGYYPTIIEPKIYHQIREARQRRRYVGGGPASSYEVNLFAGIVYCQSCGSRMRVMGAKGKYRYLSCLSAFAGAGCDQMRFAYRPVEISVLGYLQEKLIPLLAKQGKANTDPTLLMRGERDELQRRLDNMIDSLSDILRIPDQGDRGFRANVTEVSGGT